MCFLLSTAVVFKLQAKVKLQNLLKLEALNLKKRKITTMAVQREETSNSEYIYSLTIKKIINKISLLRIDLL